MNADQIGPVIDLSYAADITDLTKSSPEFLTLDPAVLELATRDGRIFGIPSELHTMAIFYNRPLIRRATSAAGQTTAPVEAPKGMGADSDPRDFLNEIQSALPPDEPVMLAQYYQQQQYQSGYQYQQQAQQPTQQRRGWFGWTQPRRQQQQQPAQQQGRSRSNRGGEQQVRDYYNLPQDQQPAQRGYESYYDTPETARQAPESDEPSDGVDTASAAPSDPDVIESANPFSDISGLLIEGGTTSAVGISALAARETETTEVVETFVFPDTWTGFIDLAAKATDHAAGVAGYAPVLFAEEGGREFSQWAVQTGVSLQTKSGEKIEHDMNTRQAAEVARFVKDLRWRYDVTPPLEKCYFDNVMRMMASGKTAMAMLPANGETMQQLLRLGMRAEDIGIAPLPGGPKNRRHLAMGRFFIINSQLDRERRQAAFRWIMFQHDAERLRMHDQYLFRENELTGVPGIPLYRPEHQTRLDDLLKSYRLLPRYTAYETAARSLLWPQPPYFRDQFYASIADGIRPIVERKESQPEKEITDVCGDFDKKYLADAPTPEGLSRYLQRFVKR